MADVFVSYARHDKARVAPLVAAIEAQGWSVWWDPAITPGQEFDQQIDTGAQGRRRGSRGLDAQFGQFPLGAGRGA